MDGPSQPIQSLLLHGSVVSSGDAPAFAGILSALRGRALELTYSRPFHAALSERGLNAPGDAVLEKEGLEGQSPDMILTFGGDGTVLETAGGTAQDLTRLTWYITDKRDYAAKQKQVGDVYRKILGNTFPAMTMVVVTGLIEDKALVEIEATAVIEL